MPKEEELKTRINTQTCVGPTFKDNFVKIKFEESNRQKFFNNTYIFRSTIFPKPISFFFN